MQTRQRDNTQKWVRKPVEGNFDGSSQNNKEMQPVVFCFCWVTGSPQCMKSQKTKNEKQLCVLKLLGPHCPSCLCDSHDASYLNQPITFKISWHHTLFWSFFWGGIYIFNFTKINMNNFHLENLQYKDSSTMILIYFCTGFSGGKCSLIPQVATSRIRVPIWSKLFVKLRLSGLGQGQRSKINFTTCNL